MSGTDRGPRALRVDRRSRRTRESVLAAFGDLVHRRQYRRIRVADILERADVGRSTFYEHFRGKDEVLLASMSGILDVLADAAFGTGDADLLERVLEHFWQQRVAARGLLARTSGEIGERIADALADRIEGRLRGQVEQRAVDPPLPVRLIAVQAAASQLALLRAWLCGAAPCAARELAFGLRLGGALGGPRRTLEALPGASHFERPDASAPSRARR